MKKSLLLLSFALLTITTSFAQKRTRKAVPAPVESAKEEDVTSDTFNKWTIEVSAGQSKGINPYTPGYFGTNNGNYMGQFTFNNWNAGFRYMFSPKFGFKVSFSSDLFENIKKTTSLEFKTQQYRLGVQGVINASRLFDTQKQFGRFNFLIHGGFHLTQRVPKYKLSPNYNRSEDDGGAIFGITPEVRIFKKLSIMADYSILLNFQQHFNWDGANDPEENLNNLSGRMSNFTLGLSYSLGKDNMHGDYAVVGSDAMESLDELEKKVADIEAIMSDTDKDGVPDYLDVENNSIAGVAVDNKGRMIDINKNGVPDELEKDAPTKYNPEKQNSGIAGGVGGKSGDSSSNSKMVAKLINEGYVAVYFDFNLTTPTTASTQAISFILNYLRSNPTATINIVGHADEIGSSKLNQKLADTRARNVKNTLIKAGINAYRLNVLPGGVDKSVDPRSSDARRLVRKVTFKVKE